MQIINHTYFVALLAGSFPDTQTHVVISFEVSK
jgi:hypothetical protein